MSAIRTKTKDLLNALNAELIEREEAVNLAFLATIAGESIFLLGPPGVGKSLIARRLKYAFADGVSFEYLMSKFSTPDEVFGPISIKKLKEEDKYERLTERYLPGANIVFLDEIWKAGPAIQNALLTILNEKIYRNGDVDLKVNIRGIITASNELPPKNKSLDPIWDRFLIRLEIGKIQSFSNFVNMITDTKDVYEDTIPQDLKLKEEELNNWSAKIDAIELPAEVLNTIQLVVYKIEEHNSRPNNADEPIKIYDRRWKKIVRLLRTSAFLNGREKVDLMDCFVMQHCLWNRPSHRDIISEMVTDSIRKHGYSLAVNLVNLKKEVADFEADVQEETQIKHAVEEEQLLPMNEDFYELAKNTNQFSGSFIKIEQFRKMDTSDWQVTNFYDEEANLRNRIKAKSGPRENTIEVFHNNEKLIIDLITRKQERNEIIFKKPHKVISDYWDSRLEKLNNYIAQQVEKISTSAPNEINHLAENLFVDESRAEVVTANLEEVKMALQDLKLRLEKLHYAYGAD